MGDSVAEESRVVIVTGATSGIGSWLPANDAQKMSNQTRQKQLFVTSKPTTKSKESLPKRPEIDTGRDSLDSTDMVTNNSKPARTSKIPRLRCALRKIIGESSNALLPVANSVPANKAPGTRSFAQRFIGIKIPITQATIHNRSVGKIVTVASVPVAEVPVLKSIPKAKPVLTQAVRNGVTTNEPCYTCGQYL
ncbi:hypothetical protein BU25DRAFT_461892 [Macroventuria anomochaeta]|uniref:Uncharacterized protein n=1 Tax=Macroventuria anomochaeta TaxID=301207 RepID=A0ACB6RP54_9PLEO|nr:uncharacterized protein BU25DRAFT_461892 [Macroventuria anomochaeta]KAF2623507.1 hypothetical protein BU25DRAFT_461892 [Macroventuria anomochaeta]